MANESISTSTLHTETTPCALFANGGKWLETMTADMQSIMQAVHSAMNHTIDCQEATLAFALNRLQKTDDVAKACVESKSPVALAQVIVDFQQALVEDYALYGQRLIDMTLAMAKANLGPRESGLPATLNELTRAA